MATVLIPIPSKDFDPTEVAVSWKVLKRLGHSVVFATPAGREGSADDIMLTGEGLDLWGFLPGLRRLVAFGRMARANADARRAYAEMRLDPAFKAAILPHKCAPVQSGWGCRQSQRRGHQMSLEHTATSQPRCPNSI